MMLCECDLEVQTNSKSSESKPKLDTIDPQSSEEKSNPIRVVVFGASGGGKSTLCNLLFGGDEFKCGDGFISCTKQPQNELFEYEIDNKMVNFEVMDSPGFFDTDDIIAKTQQDVVFKTMIENVCQFADQQVSAFLLVIPFGRMDLNHARSLQFITECFNMDAIDHLMIIFTKSGDRTVEEIQETISVAAQTTATGKFLQKCIDHISTERCFATEYNPEIKTNSREIQRSHVLTTICRIHDDKEPLSETAMWNAFQRQRQQIEEQQAEKERAVQRAEAAERKWYRTLWAVGAVTTIAGGLTLKSLQSAYKTIREMSEDKDVLQNALQAIVTQMGKIIKDKEASEAAINALQKQITDLGKQLQKANSGSSRNKQLQKQLVAASKQLQNATKDKKLLMQTVQALQNKVKEQSQSCLIL